MDAGSRQRRALYKGHAGLGAGELYAEVVPFRSWHGSSDGWTFGVSTRRIYAYIYISNVALPLVEAVDSFSWELYTSSWSEWGGALQVISWKAMPGGRRYFLRIGGGKNT